MTWRGSTTVQDRIFACLPYLLPLLDGLKYGRYCLLYTSDAADDL